MTDEKDNTPKKKATHSLLFFQSIALGVAIGAGIGVAIDNVAIGSGIGVALGLAFDSIGRRKRRADADDRPGTNPPKV